jgi:hypothetical protein
MELDTRADLPTTGDNIDYQHTQLNSISPLAQHVAAIQAAADATGTTSTRT